MAQVAVSYQPAFTMDSVPHGLAVDYMPNPDFVFPRTLPSSSLLPAASPRRPQSFHANTALRSPAEHRRAKSTMPLPTFSFNATDTSGLQESTEAVVSEYVPSTPSRGHRRTTSEFVGGDSRLLAATANSSPQRLSPQSAAPQFPSRPNHRHRRSAAISSHDVTEIMRPAEPMPRLSSSAPNSPIEIPVSFASEEDPFGPALAESVARPPSRRQVEFSDKVEFIPRPLSTISSCTEGSLSTIRGHSVNNSISSMLNLGTPSPPNSRVAISTLETTLESEPGLRSRSSLELKRVDKEGAWLRKGTVRSATGRPLSEPLSSAFNFVAQGSPVKSRVAHRARDSVAHGFELDRRRSEPTLNFVVDAGAALQAAQTIDTPSAADRESRRYSTRKLKDWAWSKVSRGSAKKHARRQSASDVPAALASTPLRLAPAPLVVPNAVAETDLDAVFGGLASPREARTPQFDYSSRFATLTPSTSQSSLGRSNVDDESSMLDLDAALGPFKTPTMGSHKQRRELHSSRLNRDFVGMGGHYQPNQLHRRTESAPMLMPFDNGRLGTSSSSTMADVFEEDEEEEEIARRASVRSVAEDESGTGIQIVDADTGAQADLDLGIRALRNGDASEWATDRTTPLSEHVPSSLVQETIMEEPSIIEEDAPVNAIEIVDSLDEPRAPSFGKSSESSDTPTILAPEQTLQLPGSDVAHPLTSPESYQTSAFSTPDLSRGQTSFDTSRLGTSASSVTDNRTMSSCTTGGERDKSLDDIPSLTSSRSTMISVLQPNVPVPRREVGELRAATSHGSMDTQRRKRQSLQSLLIGAPFTRSITLDESRPQTANLSGEMQAPRRPVEHRLKKLMFWRTKSRLSTSD